MIIAKEAGRFAKAKKSVRLQQGRRTLLVISTGPLETSEPEDFLH